MEKSRNVVRKLVVERWVQERMFDIGWLDEKKCRGSDQEAGAEKHSLCHCPSRREVRKQISECLGRWEQRAGTSKDWKVATRHQIAFSERRHWEDKSRFSPKEGSLKNTRAGTRQSKAFGWTQRHRQFFVASLKRWSASGWSVVQQDHDERMRPMRGMCGTLCSDLEVQRNIKRAEIDNFLVPLQNECRSHQGSCGQQRNR